MPKRILRGYRFRISATVLASYHGWIDSSSSSRNKKINENNVAGDPLTRAYRRRLKMLKIDRGIPVAHSIEKPNVPEGEHVGDFRTRQLPILGPISSMLGMSIATFIILNLAEFSAMPIIPARIRDNLYNRIIHDVTERETKVYKNKYVTSDS